MIKKINELTDADKQRFLRAVERDYKTNYNIPWTVIEQSAQAFLDQAFDDRLYPKMSPDDQIDAAHCRKAFNNTKPALVDYMIWSVTLATHSEYIEIPDF